MGALVGMSIAGLSNDERIAHYRGLALQAMDHAQRSAAVEHRCAWLSIAATWAALADEVERQARRAAEIAAMQAA